MTSVKTISEPKKDIFDEKVNSLLSEGFLILSSNCWTGGSHEDGFFDMYQAILVREDTTPSGQEMFTLTASKEHLISLLYAMCVGCKAEGCDFCILSNLVPAIEEDCPFIDNPYCPGGDVLFDVAKSNEIIRRSSS